MSNPAEDPIRSALNGFLSTVAKIREIHDRDGPGNVPVDLFPKAESLLDESRRHLDVELSPDLDESLHMLLKLGYRCTYHSQGLHFISGEAGLVPRQDLNREFDRSLKIVRDYLENVA